MTTTVDIVDIEARGDRMAVLELVFDSEPEPAPAPESLASDWMAVATRAHAILTQTLPDELLDEVAAGPGVGAAPFKFPVMLVG